MTYIYDQFTNGMNLQFFAEGGTNVIGTASNVNAYTGAQMAQTAANSMSATMKRYYDTELLENARNEHYHAQFGNNIELPRGRGKTLEWRKFNTLPNADRLVEGVIPAGKDFGMTHITTDIKQYGMYLTISDQLELHAIDDIILGATEELGASAGETQDTAIRNVLMEGTNVMFAEPCDEEGNPTRQPAPVGRWGLTMANRLTPQMVNKVVTRLKKLKAPKIDGKYIAIIHPSVSHDLRESKYWIEAHKYCRPEEMYNGEIGELHGVRFIETPTAIVWRGTTIGGLESLSLTTTYTTNDTTAYAEYGDATAFRAVISETPNKDMVGHFVHVYDASASGNVGTVKIVGVDTKTKAVWFDIGLGITPATGDKLMPGEGGAAGEGGDPLAVYGCLFLGKGAYGIVNPDGAALEMIVKDKNQAGGPLNQFSTLGFKFSSGAKILYQERMIRVECCSAFSESDEDNSNPIAQADPVQQH